MILDDLQGLFDEIVSTLLISMFLMVFMFLNVFMCFCVCVDRSSFGSVSSLRATRIRSSGGTGSEPSVATTDTVNKTKTNTYKYVKSNIKQIQHVHIQKCKYENAQLQHIQTHMSKIQIQTMLKPYTNKYKQYEYKQL